MDGDLYGYWSCSSTWIFHVPPAKGAEQTRHHGRGGELSRLVEERSAGLLTFRRPGKTHVELLHRVVDQSHLVIGHETVEEGQERDLINLNPAVSRWGWQVPVLESSR